MKDRSMAIKHAKAKKETIKEVLENQNRFAITSWGTTDTAKRLFHARPYAM
jgi:hypothetical protein